MTNLISPVEVAKHAYNAGFRGLALIKAIAIAWAESGLDANAVGDVSLVDNKWGESVGLWQIRSLKNPAAYSYPDTLRIKAQLFDAGNNAKAAYAISKQGTDFSPWSVYNNGAYENYMDTVTEAIKDAGEFLNNNATSVAGGGAGLIAALIAVWYFFKK